MTYILIVLSVLLIGNITGTVLIWQHFKKTNNEAKGFELILSGKISDRAEYCAKRTPLHQLRFPG